MNNLIYKINNMTPLSFDTWYDDYFGNVPLITLDQFTTSAKTVTGKTLIEYFKDANVMSIKKHNIEDFRWTNKDEILYLLYEATIINRKETLRAWFDDHINIKSIEPYIKFNVDQNYEKMVKISDELFTINGKYKNNLNRLIKNIYPYEIYNTDKTHHEETTISLLQAWFNNLTFSTQLVIPSFIKKIIKTNKTKQDWHDLFAILRGTTDSASVFNPYTAGWIIQNIYKGKKLLTPVIDWNSYMIGFLNTKWTEYVGIDVIPEVIQNSKKIWDHHQNLNSINSLFQENKSLTLYCTPSEEIDEKFNFSEKYNKYFDGIFFSPPYFDLEQYEKYKGLENTQQSIAKFKTYEEWLIGYWEPTVKLCSKVMNDDGNFGFVVSNYTDKKTGFRNISNDMYQICTKYFTLKQHYKIQWANFTKRASKSNNGNYEDFWFFEKLNN